MFLQDIFHFGKISKTLGNAFACSREEGWKETYVTSASGLSTERASIRYDDLINRQAERDTEDPSNAVKFFVPVTAVNTEESGEGLNRMVSVSVQSGESNHFVGVVELDVLAFEEPGTPDAPSVGTVRNTFDMLLFTLNSPQTQCTAYVCRAFLSAGEKLKTYRAGKKQGTNFWSVTCGQSISKGTELE